jgi:16S rRNA (adenine1518-N6/adenine1519-N6)-dimethyltransferase
MMKHQARKRFGQYFLNDNKVIESIVQAIAPQTSQLLVEIGPGLGALTLPILQQSKKLHVIEIDRDIIPKLEHKCRNLGELITHPIDALQFDVSTLLKLNPAFHQVRVFGNLPYHISSPLLFHLFQQIQWIQDMHFMFQKEVAERITASVGTADYGRLSVMAQYYCHTEFLLHVPSSAFKPHPKVDSGFIRLIPYKKISFEAHSLPLFQDIVKTAFTYRRKTLRNALQRWVPQEEMWNQLKIDPQKRPENLSVENYVTISNYLQTHTR